MSGLDLSIIIKTFLRPQCLFNLLDSIRKYQNAYNIVFDELIIVDDSDDESKIENENIIKQFSDLKINYKQCDFNSVGLSAGRNIGLSLCKTKYFLLCDDDFIFDTECDIMQNLDLLKSKKLDMLCGHCKDLKSFDDQNPAESNWLGFITENETFDLVNIFTDQFPDFCYCDIGTNFCIARTESVKKVGYPEDLPVLEHNVFFLRAKHHGLKVGQSGKLWTKHLHLQGKSYSGFRNRTIVNPIKKDVVGYLFTGNVIIRFFDYFHVGSDERYILQDLTPKKKKHHSLISRIFKR